MILTQACKFIMEKVLPKSRMANFPSGVRIIFPGCGSAWKKPVSRSCKDQNNEKKELTGRKKEYQTGHPSL